MAVSRVVLPTTPKAVLAIGRTNVELAGVKVNEKVDTLNGTENCFPTFWNRIQGIKVNAEFLKAWK